MKNTLLALTTTTTLSLFLFPNISKCDLILQSPLVTNWGEWGNWEQCPENTFVIAMELKSDRFTTSDQSGLSGIKFYCSKPGTYNGTEIITSLTNTIGNYGSKFYCGNVAIGFQLRSERNQANGDDSGATNLRLFCSSDISTAAAGGNVQGKRSFLEGDGTEKGEWTTPQLCFKRQAICGIQTMVESEMGSAGDDTGLNNIRVKCCDVPNPSTTCIPSDDWDLLVECDNLVGLSPMTCSYQKRIGTSQTEIQSEGQIEESSFYESLDFSTGFASNGLSLNFKYNLGHSHKTGFSWDQSSSNEWHEETMTTISFEVGAGIKTTLFQVLGKCGIYNVRPVRFRKVDSRNLTNPAMILENVL